MVVDGITPSWSWCCSPGSGLGPVQPKSPSVVWVRREGAASARLDLGNSLNSPPSVVESPSPGALRDVWMWHLGTGVCGAFGSAGVTAGFDDPKGLCQPKQFCDSKVGAT